MIVIGSQAMKYWFPDFNREPKDLDIVVDDFTPQYMSEDGRRVERLRNPILLKYCEGFEDNYAVPDTLLTLKMSHLFWDIAWDKHMWDVQFLFKHGAKCDKKLFYELYEYWNKVHSLNRRSALAMSATDFFDNVLTCPYDHDWLHTLLNSTPTYQKVLKDDAEVDVSEEKFNALTEKEKAALVREEVMVMAFERWPTLDYRKAYGRMLKKFIISHAPMWEALWIIENYIPLTKPGYDFITHLKEQINISDDVNRRRNNREIKGVV